MVDVGTQLGKFEIVGLLGKGGMGEVYRATDSKLGRDVAIKVLPKSFAADEERLARFEREAQTLASLNHPNVATVHGFEHDAEQGVHFLVMEHIDGETLGQRIESGALSVSEVLPLFIDIARGLDAAHEAGIVHRDMKPDNVKINQDGVVKILDFGIAKSTGVSNDTDPDAATTPMSPVALTAEGTFMGTPVYMSPEQARGKAVDKRTDIWAFGCCLYEALTGKLPFVGDTVADTVGSILKIDPDWSNIPQDAPPEIRSLLRRCLEKDARKRFSSAGDMAYMLQEYKDRSESLVHQPKQAELTLHSEAPARSWAPVIIGTVVALLGIFLGILMNRDSEPQPQTSNNLIPAITSLAVLPLENLKGDPEEDYFVDGMTEALTAELSKISSLKVISRTSVMRYKGSEKSAGEIAEELGVKGLIDGSVMRIDDEVRITVQLIDAENDTQLWSETYDNTLENVFKLHSEVALAIAEEIRATITPAEADRLASAETVDSAAHAEYLKALHFYSQQTRESIQASIAHLEKATELDPNFAMAWAYLPRVLGDGAGWGFTLGEDSIKKSKAAAERAVALAPDLAIARYGMGTARWHADWDWGMAEDEFRLALELAPGDGELRYNYGWMLLLAGRGDEAVQRFTEGIELSPLSLPMLFSKSYALSNVRKYEEAITVADQALLLEPDFPVALFTKGMALLHLDRHDAAIEVLSRTVDRLDSDNALAKLAIAHIGNEDHEAARQTLSKMIENETGRFQQDAHIASVYGHLNEPDRAFEHLQKAIDERHWSVLELRTDPIFDPLRSDSRFWDMVDKIGYPKLPTDSPLVIREREYKEAIAKSTVQKIEKIAVLPFANNSGDPDQEYFVDGMTEELITELAQIRSLKVISRTSAMRYKNTLTPIPQIARELGVQAVVEGSVLRVENDVRISVQLIDARNDEHLWASRYNGTLDNILQLQGEVALAVAKEVGAQLTPEDRDRFENARHIDPDAMELYRQGRYLQRARTGNTLTSAGEAFRRALEIEPEFASVHIALAENLALNGILGMTEPSTVLPSARAAAERALEIDPGEGAAYAVLGLTKFMSGDPMSEAIDLFERAIELDPGNAQTRLWYCISLFTTRDYEAIQTQLSVAKELDPFAPLTSWSEVMISTYSGDINAGVAAADRLIELHPQYGNGLWIASLAYLLADDLDSAREAIDRSIELDPNMKENVGVQASVLWRMGDLEALNELEADLEDRFDSGQKRFARHIARIHLERGDRARALDWLEKARSELGFGYFDLRFDPVWEPIRDDPRFQSLLKPEPSK